MHRQVVLLSLLLLIAALLPAPPALSTPPGKIDPALQQRMADAPPQERLPVLVLLRERVDMDALYPQLVPLGRRARHELVVHTLQETAARTQGPLLDYLRGEASRGRAASIEPFWIANVVAVEATPAVLNELARRSDVLSLRENQIYSLEEVAGAPAPPGSPHAVEPGITLIGAEQMWARGWTGSGVLVATVDTGAYLPHAALQSQWRGNEPGVPPEDAWFDYFGQSSVPSDTHACQSHGTHVMGTIVGDDGAGNQIGAAPGARWIAARIFGPPGTACSSSDATKLAGWQWVIDPDGDPGTVDDFPHVVNRSGGEKGPGGGGLCRPLPDPIWDAIHAVAAAGATIFFGAGNEGPAPESIISWASQAQSPILAFSVGNLNGQTKIIHSSSSRGPSPCDHISIKPEVTAPGVYIRSSVIDGYGVKTGTSMSTPHASGAAALLWQAFPHAGAEQIQYALLNGVEDLGDPGEDNVYGTGLIHLDLAYHQLFGLDPSTMQVTPSLVFPGASLTYTLVLHSQGQVSGTARLSDTLPTELSLIPGSLWAASGQYASANGQITWTGVLYPEQPITVTFAATLSAPFSDGAQLENVALLDDGLEVITRSAAVIVDSAPASSRASGPAYARTPFSVTFVASDTVSGVAQTELWVRYQDGAWAGTGLIQAGQNGSFFYTPTQGQGYYYLASRAIDEVGQLEGAPQGEGDDLTIWDTLPPSSTVLVPTDGSGLTLTISWKGEEGAYGSGIAGYHIEVRQHITGSTWTVWISETTALSGTFSGKEVAGYCFRSRAHDRAGNVEPFPVDPWGDVCTQEGQRWKIFLPLLLRQTSG